MPNRKLSENPAPDKPKYDKILVKDCVRYLADPRETYANMVASLAPGGKLLLIHRPGQLSTLPYFSDAKQRFVLFVYVTRGKTMITRKTSTRRENNHAHQT